MKHLVRLPDQIRSLLDAGFQLSGSFGSYIFRKRGQKTHLYAIKNQKGGHKMAKIKYASFVTGLSGRTASSVFMRSSSPTFGYLREYVYPTLTDQNAQRGKEFQNLTLQYKSIDAAAITQLKAYAAKYANLPQTGKGDISVRANNSVAVWILAMWNLYKEQSSYDPESITLEDLVTLTGINSVADFVTSGYLPAVEGWEDMTAPLKP